MINRQYFAERKNIEFHINCKLRILVVLTKKVLLLK
jgi:hypothetical protein